MIETRPLRVFLCHASQDKPTVREIYFQLKAIAWIDPWLDEEKILPGQDWDLEIKNAVRGADLVIVFLSNNSISKTGYVQKEIKQALDVADEQLEGVIFIIPIRLDDCKVPSNLTKWQWLDYFTNEAKAFQSLLAVLEKKRPKEGINLSSKNVLERASKDLIAAYDQTIEGWAIAIEARNGVPEEQTKRIAELTIKLAQFLGSSDDDIVNIRRGALLHDLGKLGIPDEILKKYDRLSAEDWIVYKRYPQYTYQMLSPITYLKDALVVCLKSNLT